MLNIIWSQPAQDDRKAIFSYWNKRNQSFAYSQKLNAQFEATLALLAEFPNLSKATDMDNVRVKIVMPYCLFFEVNDGNLVVLAIRHTRQENNKLS